MSIFEKASQFNEMMNIKNQLSWFYFEFIKDFYMKRTQILLQFEFIERSFLFRHC